MRTGGRLLLAFVVGACGGGERAPWPTESPVGPVAADPQRDGDADAGYAALINAGYVGCGVPYSAYSQVFAAAPESERLPGRDGVNAEMPYNMTAFDTASGVKVVSPNCLQCHAETLRGELVVGLVNLTADYTVDIGVYAILSGALVTDPVEREEWQRWSDRMVAISPWIITDTIGVNPADNLAAVLFAHRDRDTLAWSWDERIELPPPVVVPVDVPAWWHMRKKNAMFYLAAGRGDHARIMMTASTLCVESVDEARAVDAYFPDVRAFLMTLEPPAWPFAVDSDLAEAGRAVFETTCARCHGTYGESETYPNLVIDIDEVGTDDTLARGTSQYAGEFVSWFNASFYGELAYLAPAPGYIAPPRDGIWATAPYLHNGSVPTLAGLLDSATRPRYWTWSGDTSDLDEAAVGWRHQALDAGQEAAASEEERVRIYDTTHLGYGNRGHTFGDALSDGDRRAVIEYLKTL
jgi:mono/diheme cytochrome c family protein